MDNRENDKRILGDEWVDWDGNSGRGRLDEPAHLFILLSSATSGILCGVLLFQWYLIKPRLDQFSVWLSPILFYSIIILLFLIIPFFLLMQIPRLIAFPLFSNLKPAALFFIRFLLPVSVKIGAGAGLSIDKIGSSFIKVHNSLTRAAWLQRPAGKTMILLPRCLKKEMIQELKKLEEIYEVEVAVLGGGSAALKLLKEKRPSSVIGVACERDIINGIKDMNSKIAVLGIPNERPEGPCKNTVINIAEIERAVQLFASRKGKAAGLN